MTSTRRFLRALRNFFTGRLFLTLLCATIAGFAAFYYLPTFYKNQEAVLVIPRVKLPLEVGELIEARHLELVEIGAYNLPSSAMTDRDEIVGSYARVAMLPGDFIFAGKLSSWQIDPELDIFLQSGMKLVTVTPKGAAQTVASYLSPGDIVSAGTIHDERQEGGGVTKVVYYPEELSHLLIFGVENNRGMPLASGEEEIALASGQGAYDDLIPKSITFVVDQIQAAMLIEAEYNGGFHLIFEERRAK